ncbi:MAG: hypothetical protein ACSLE6_06610 [Mycobacterium sp.]
MTTAGRIRRDTDPSDRRKALLHYEDQGMALARDFCTHLGDVDRAAMLMRALGA